MQSQSIIQLKPRSKVFIKKRRIYLSVLKSMQDSGSIEIVRQINPIEFIGKLRTDNGTWSRIKHFVII